MSKGTIILTPFPFTNLSGNKVRPALILFSHRNSEDCIVSFISSIDKNKQGYYDVKVVPTGSNGLKVDSIVKVNKIATIQRKIILGELGVLESSLLFKVDDTLKTLFDL